MHSRQFVMISKAYSDGMSLAKDGPRLTREFSSECVLDKGRSFRTAASFVPKLVAKHFVTTLTVGDDLTYYESVMFERRTVMRNFSETTNVFIPREKSNVYCSSLLFEPDSTSRRYTAGIELLPAQKFAVTEDLSGEGDAKEFESKEPMNGVIDDSQQMVNGDV